jgi:hypothetical protein
MLKYNKYEKFYNLRKLATILNLVNGLRQLVD